MQDVIVENRKTGQRKTMTKVMAKLLESKYRIIDDESQQFVPPPSEKTDLTALKEQYFKLFGQQPHHRLGEARLKELIEEEKKKVPA